MPAALYQGYVVGAACCVGARGLLVGGIGAQVGGTGLIKGSRGTRSWATKRKQKGEEQKSWGDGGTRDVGCGRRRPVASHQSPVTNCPMPVTGRGRASSSTSSPTRGGRGFNSRVWRRLARAGATTGRTWGVVLGDSAARYSYTWQRQVRAARVVSQLMGVGYDGEPMESPPVWGYPGTLGEAESRAPPPMPAPTSIASIGHASLQNTAFPTVVSAARRMLPGAALVAGCGLADTQPPRERASKRRRRRARVRRARVRRQCIGMTMKPHLSSTRLVLDLPRPKPATVSPSPVRSSCTRNACPLSFRDHSLIPFSPPRTSPSPRCHSRLTSAVPQLSAFTASTPRPRNAG